MSRSGAAAPPSSSSSAAPAARTVGAWRSVGSSAGTKLNVMAVSSVVSVVTTHLVISRFGVEAYAQYGLLASLGALLPFSDLGMGAAVLNAVGGSKDPRQDDLVRRTLLSALRVVICSAAVISTAAVVLWLTGLWPLLLGDGLLPGSGPVAATLCLLLFAVTLPAAVGQRVLTATGRNHTRILVQGLTSPLFAVAVVLLVAVGAPGGGYLSVFSYAAGALAAGFGALLAGRVLGGLSWRVVRELPRLRSAPGAPVLAVGWPVLVQTLALPVAMQSDRLVLSHLSTPEQLAQYTLAAALFSIPLQTITAAGIALWPVFARARTEGTVRSPLPLVLGFLAAGLAVAGALALAMPWVAGVVSSGRIEPVGWVLVGFVLLVAVQAALYPTGMYMSDPRGLRFQVLPVLVMVVVNTTLSLLLAPRLGAAGPVLASAAAVGLCQLLPYALWVRADLARRREALRAASSSSNSSA